MVLASLLPLTPFLLSPQWVVQQLLPQRRLQRKRPHLVRDLRPLCWDGRRERCYKWLGRGARMHPWSSLQEQGTCPGLVC